ncbi:MAG: hypothetical protein JO109_01760 [Alphaproteobacteria bacterium]|nr:hypothetical protein [Alphaproteobacteria bacterium]
MNSRDLSRVVDEAVKAATQRNAGSAAALGGHNVIVRPDILGRMIRDLTEAQHFSQAVASGVSKSGIQVDPVVIPIGKGGHLAGFVERDSLNLREF